MNRTGLKLEVKEIISKLSALKAKEWDTDKHIRLLARLNVLDKILDPDAVNGFTENEEELKLLRDRRCEWGFRKQRRRIKK